MHRISYISVLEQLLRYGPEAGKRKPPLINTHNFASDMVNSLQGLCRANCWAHYDGVDLLDYETLSILTTQLQQINLAQSMNLKEFHLSGKKTQLGLQTGFFFLSRNCETLLDGEGKLNTGLFPIEIETQRRLLITY